jgi:hypothetical protein
VADEPQVVGGARDHYVEEHAVFLIVRVAFGDRIDDEDSRKFQALHLVSISHHNSGLEGEIIPCSADNHGG